MAKSFKTISMLYFKIFLSLFLISILISLILHITQKYEVKSTTSIPTPIPTKIPTQAVSRAPTDESISSTQTPDIAGPGEHCGGFIRTAKQCINGYHCQTGHIFDKGGVCVKD